MKGWGVFMGFGNKHQNEAKYYDLFHQNKDYEREALEIAKKFPQAKTILEIGCGTGNLTKELERLCYKVTCIEPSLEMLKYFKGDTKEVFNRTIQEYVPPPWKFDLVLAMYDVLNYIPKDDLDMVMKKISSIGKEFHCETWNPMQSFHYLTHKIANGCHRIRLGFKFNNTAYLWFIFWGRGLVISKHKLYL